MDYRRPSSSDLERHFLQKYGSPATSGWGPKRRYRNKLVLAGDLYECYLDKIVTGESIWVDVGGGSSILPHNPKLSQDLAERCRKLVSVDPSKNVLNNPYCHEKFNNFFENFETSQRFNLATFRMVAEHIENPEQISRKLMDVLDDDGMVVIYTINKHCPIPLITRMLPFRVHYSIKKFFWGGKEEDTFPVQYKMNSKADLSKIFKSSLFEMVDFRYFDDTSTTINFNVPNKIEVLLWRIFRKLGIPYLENNIFAVYKKRKCSV
jgi:hypothetical protein